MTPDASKTGMSRRKRYASSGVRASGRYTSPESTSSRRKPLRAAAIFTGSSRVRSWPRLPSPAYSRIASPSGRCWALPCRPRRGLYVARNANGASGSARFSARWKCTRPTTCQASCRARRNASRGPSNSPSSARHAAVMASQHPARAAFRYSPPGIGGAPAARARISASGNSTFRCRRLASAAGNAPSLATKARPRSRQKAIPGGSGVSTSAAPRCRSPCPTPRAKAASIRAATGPSRGSASGIAWSTSAPDGVTPSASRSPGGSELTAISWTVAASLPPRAGIDRGRRPAILSSHAEEGRRGRASCRPTARRHDAICARPPRPAGCPRLPVGGDGGTRVSQPPAPRGGVRPAHDDARAGRPRDGQSRQDARRGGLPSGRPGPPHPLSHRRPRAGRPQPGVGLVPGRAPADDDHRRSLAARHPPQLQGRDLGDRRRRRHRAEARPPGERGRGRHPLSRAPRASRPRQAPAAPRVTTLGFVGLGAMGSRMARRLLEAGHPLVGYNRTASKAERLVAAGMKLATSPRGVAEAADVIFSMVTDTSALHAIAHGGKGVIAGLRPGTAWVEMSTVSPVISRALAARAGEAGATFLDAPVSGSIATLEQGQLSFMVGGDAGDLERVRPYLLAIGPTITHVGPVGLAVTMKIATNLGLAVQMLAFSEAVLLAEKSGIARARAVEALLKSVIA